MGGSKKVSPAKQEKSQAPKDSKKGKKDKGEGGPTKAEITVVVNEQQAMKFIKGAKVITVQELARQTGVKISAANAFLRNSLKNGAVKKVGGYSGHYVYRAVSS
ncbi:MAG: MarR family transcriptional regulator [Nitrosarchaeum sp.]|nr:MarR family transcriptional regulator [Nitrosarchaeum sp.]